MSYDTFHKPCTPRISLLGFLGNEPPTPSFLFSRLPPSLMSFPQIVDGDHLAHDHQLETTVSFSLNSLMTVVSSSPPAFLSLHRCSPPPCPTLVCLSSSRSSEGGCRHRCSRQMSAKTNSSQNADEKFLVRCLWFFLGKSAIINCLEVSWYFTLCSNECKD